LDDEELVHPSKTMRLDSAVSPLWCLIVIQKAVIFTNHLIVVLVFMQASL